MCRFQRWENGQKDNGCDKKTLEGTLWYKKWPNTCGDYDDEDFRAKRMCCLCGGGYYVVRKNKCSFPSKGTYSTPSCNKEKVTEVSDGDSLFITGSESEKAVIDGNGHVSFFQVSNSHLELRNLILQGGHALATLDDNDCRGFKSTELSIIQIKAGLGSSTGVFVNCIFRENRAFRAVVLGRGPAF